MRIYALLFICTFYFYNHTHIAGIILFARKMLELAAETRLILGF